MLILGIEGFARNTQVYMGFCWVLAVVAGASSDSCYEMSTSCWKARKNTRDAKRKRKNLISDLLFSRC
jgi:hypothetical protein